MKNRITVYVVTMQGVNIQGVHGPYYTKIGAKKAAQVFANTDVDDYHVWEVRELTPKGLGNKIASYQKLDPRYMRSLEEALREDEQRYPQPKVSPVLVYMPGQEPA